MKGIGLAVLAAVLFGASTPLSKVLSGTLPPQHQTQLPSASVLVGTILTGTMGYGVSLAAIVSALRYLGAARTGVYFSLAPFVGATPSLVLIHEPLTPRLAATAIAARSASELDQGTCWMPTLTTPNARAGPGSRIAVLGMRKPDPGRVRRMGSRLIRLGPGFAIGSIRH